MQDALMTEEMASQEVHRWLNGKRVSKRKIEQQADAIETLVDGLMEGDITIDESGVITQKLKFPVKNADGSMEIKELKYQPRIDTGTVNKKLQNAKTDFGSIVSAYASALTGQTTGIIAKLDTVDNNVARAVVAFFI